MIYFDNASTTFPKMDKFYRETMEIYQSIGINFSRENNSTSMKMSDIKGKLINNIKKIYKLSDVSRVIFNSSATFSLNEIIQGLDYSKIKNVYISPFEHNSVYRVIKKIEREKNINLEIIKFNKFDLDINDLKLKFLSQKPDLIISTHASNVFGNIIPVKEIFEEGKKYDAITILDTAQTGGILDYSEIIRYTDFLVFAGHKNLYGPSGIGGYVINNEKIKLEPLLFGGTGIKSEEISMPEDLPERYEAGSPNTLGIIGLKLATDELLEIGIENIYIKKQNNLKKLMEILKEYEDELEIYSEEKNNVGIILINSKHTSPKELEIFFDEYDVIVRSGLQCSPLAYKHMGIEEGGVRLSVGYFNKDEDFEKFENILEEVL